MTMRQLTMLVVALPVLAMLFAGLIMFGLGEPPVDSICFFVRALGSCAGLAAVPGSFLLIFWLHIRYLYCRRCGKPVAYVDGRWVKLIAKDHCEFCGKSYCVESEEDRRI